eukprot:5523655-Amphidinium_carterae.1
MRPRLTRDAAPPHKCLLEACMRSTNHCSVELPAWPTADTAKPKGSKPCVDDQGTTVLSEHHAPLDKVTRDNGLRGGL